MHSKRKGNIGQLATGYWLSKFGISVFTEEGDISQVDVIAEINGSLTRFQCKAITPKNDSLSIPLRKCGPGYIRKYKEVFDYFAVYDLENGNLYLVPVNILRTNDSSFVLRLKDAKNKQKKGVHLAENYLAERILRDFTGNTQTNNVEGNDKVQTTTP